MKTLRSAAALIVATAVSAFALAGAGFHWGFDFTTSMPDTEQEWLSFGSTDALIESANLEQSLETELQNHLGGRGIMHVSRLNFERGNINFGGKAFVDPPLLPFSIEASMNFGSWLYDGALHYIDPDKLTNSLEEGNLPNPDSLYAAQPITVAALGGAEYFGLDKTPYGKLQFDLTLKKELSTPIVKPHFGVGASAHFETPVLSQELIDNALDQDMSSLDVDQLDDLTSDKMMKKILDEITEGAKEPKMGMHFLAGAKIKLPVIPLGFYADGKYMLVFNNDKYETETNGVLVNIGVMLGI
ncbi:MAG: hypothetical protein ACQEQV_03615 [Fibrobacterota bacterium]